VAIAFGLPVPFLSGYFMDRYGRRAVIAPGFGAYAVSLVVMSLTAFFPQTLPITFFYFCYVLVQATAGTTGGTMQVLGADLSPTVNRGRFFAIWRMIAQLAAMVAPAGYAFVSDGVGYGAGFLYMALCAGVVVVGVSVILGDTQARHRQAETAGGDPRPASTGGRRH
jgi:MFS family permease